MSSISNDSELHVRIRKLIKQYREDPGSSLVLRELGQAYHEMQQLDTAIFYLEQALVVDPQDWEAHVILGRLYADKKAYEETLSHYSRAYELSRQLDLLPLVGEALYLLKRYPMAEVHLRSTIHLEGSHQRGLSHFLLGKVLCALERYDEAFEEFQAAERFKKTDETSKWLAFAKTRINKS